MHLVAVINLRKRILMPKADKRYLTKVKGYYHFVRRIPHSNEKIRVSTGTKNLSEAQKKRDELLIKYSNSFKKIEDSYQFKQLREQIVKASSEEEWDCIRDVISDKADDIAYDLGVYEALQYKHVDDLTDKEKEPITFYRKAANQLHEFKDYVEDFVLEKYKNKKTQQQARQSFEVLMTRFGCVEQCDKDDVRMFLKTIGRERNISKATVQKYCAYYRSFWEYLDMEPVVWNNIKIPNNPNKPKMKKEEFTKEEYNFVLQSLGKANDKTSQLLKHVVAIAAHTGARQEAITRMEYNEDQQSLWFPALKYEENERIIPAHPHIKNDLKIWSENKRSKSWIGNEFSERKKALGFSKTQTFHSLRRTFMTELRYANANYTSIQYMVGHNYNKTVTDIYIGHKHSESRLRGLRKEIEKLDLRLDVA